jgi:hypothetical protein
MMGLKVMCFILSKKRCAKPCRSWCYNEDFLLALISVLPKRDICLEL